MSTITKEWLQQKIAHMEAARDEIPFGLDEDDSNTLAALRIALASREAEPYGYVHKAAYEQAGSCGLSNDHEAYSDSLSHIAVYTTPPAAVFPRDLEEIIFTIVNAMADEKLRNDESELFSLARKYIEHAKSKLSAAMLKGAEPVTTANKLPANTPCKEAPEHIWLQTTGVWPENGEFSELTWCSDNQHPDDTLYVRADVVADNSPVVPDGWKLVPVIAFPSQWAAGQKAFNSAGINKVDAVYKAMVAAAPQQEVKQ